MLTPEIITKLQDFIKTNYDTENRFKQVLQKTTDETLKKWLRNQETNATVLRFGYKEVPQKTSKNSLKIWMQNKVANAVLLL